MPTDHTARPKPRTVVTSGPVPLIVAFAGPATAGMTIAITLASADLSTGTILAVVAGCTVVGLAITAGALLYRRSTRIIIGPDGISGANQHSRPMPWDHLWGFWWEVVNTGATTGNLDPRPVARLAMSTVDGQHYAVTRWVTKGPFANTSTVARELRAAAHDSIVPDHIVLPSDDLPAPQRTVGATSAVFPNSQRPQPPTG